MSDYPPVGESVLLVIIGLIMALVNPFFLVFVTLGGYALWVMFNGDME